MTSFAASVVMLRWGTAFGIVAPSTIASAGSEAMILSLYSCGRLHSLETMNLVPIWIPEAPKALAAARPLPSANPPAATTGILTAAVTIGTRTIVVTFPIKPPDSMPSAMIISAPTASILSAAFSVGTTGATLTPAFFNCSIYDAGFPPPVVIRATPSSQTASMISGTLGINKAILTPKGLLVSSLIRRIPALILSIPPS